MNITPSLNLLSISSTRQHEKGAQAKQPEPGHLWSCDHGLKTANPLNPKMTNHILNIMKTQKKRKKKNND